MAVSINPKGSAFAKEIKLGAARGEAISRKSAIPALNMGSDELVTDFAQVQFSELVMDESVLGNLVSRARRVPFNTRIVVQTDGSVGYWTGEGDAIGLSQIALYSTAITPLHVASILVASDEFVRHASADAENVLRRDLARGLALQIDQTLLDPTNAGSEVKPAAITYGLSAEDTFADMMTEGFTGDLTKSVWVARPETWMGIQTVIHPNLGLHGGEFQGAPAFASRSAPENSLILIDPTGLTLALGELEYEISRFGSVEMVDEPTQHSDGSPESPSDDPVASTVVSLYQANAVAIKLSQYINWKVRPGSVGLITFDQSPSGSPF